MEGNGQLPENGKLSQRKDRNGLTMRQKRFVNEYVIDLNATQAAIRAGFSAANAGKIGFQLLEKTRVKSAIDKRLARIDARSELTAAEARHQLACIAASDVGDVIEFNGDVLRTKVPLQIPARARKAVASVKVRRRIVGTGEDSREIEEIEWRFWNKTEAIKQLAELNRWVDKSPGINVNVGIVQDLGQVMSKAEEQRRALAVESRIEQVEHPNGNGQ